MQTWVERTKYEQKGFVSVGLQCQQTHHLAASSAPEEDKSAKHDIMGQRQARFFTVSVSSLPVPFTSASPQMGQYEEELVK